MSDGPLDTHDPLLAALRELPSHPAGGAADARLQREARAAYMRSFEGSRASGEPSGLFASAARRAAVPLFLACVVGVYMTWAIAAATALVR